MLWDITKELLGAAKRPFREPYEEYFSRGVAHTEISPAMIADELCADGFIFGIIRNPDGIITHPFIADRPILIMIRDPRDVIVSLYYSLFSHRTTGGSVDKEFKKLQCLAGPNPSEFAKTAIAASLLDRYMLYAQFAATHDNARVLRYEDFIYRKGELARIIASFLKLELKETTIDQIAARFDVFPAGEDPGAQVRSVVPGNYARHLENESLRLVEETFADVLAAFGYPPETFVPFGYGEKGARMVPDLARERRELYAALHSTLASQAEVGERKAAA